MNSRLTSILLILLLLGTTAFGVWQYSETQRVRQETKQQLDALSDKLTAAQTNQTRLEQELADAQNENRQLKERVRWLEANITALQEQLEDAALRAGAITVGLTFLWNPALPLEVMRLSQVVKYINRDFWAPLSIYFFVYHARLEVWIPLTYKCSGSWTWSERATHLYPERDIPVGIFQQSLDNSAGCASVIPESKVIAIDALSTGLLLPAEIWDRNPSKVLGGPIVGLILVHEQLHVFGFSDKETEALGVWQAIPPVWYARIQVAAKWFQISVPST